MVKYTYNACGNIVTEVLECNANALAELNPFRYRGYYYDIETELYFLKSRYYDPELGRFMTIDDVSYLDPDTINGLNLYAYCGNNSILRADPYGTSWWNWLLSGIEVVSGVALCFVPGVQAIGVTLIGTGIGALIKGYITESNGGTFNAGWIGGQVAGVISLVPGVGNILGAVASSIVADAIDLGVDNIDYEKAIWSGVLSWAITLFPSIVSEIAGKYKINDAMLYLTTAFNSIVTSIANSIINVYWRGDNGK